jgi:hypothetical protein
VKEMVIQNFELFRIFSTQSRALLVSAYQSLPRGIASDIRRFKTCRNDLGYFRYPEFPTTTFFNIES